MKMTIQGRHPADFTTRATLKRLFRVSLLHENGPRHMCRRVECTRGMDIGHSSPLAAGSAAVEETL